MRTGAFDLELALQAAVDWLERPPGDRADDSRTLDRVLRRAVRLELPYLKEMLERLGVDSTRSRHEADQRTNWLMVLRSGLERQRRQRTSVAG